MGVGPDGAFQTFESAQEVLASGKLVSYVTIGQRAIATKDLWHLSALPSVGGECALSVANSAFFAKGVEGSTCSIPRLPTGPGEVAIVVAGSPEQWLEPDLVDLHSILAIHC